MPSFPQRLPRRRSGLGATLLVVALAPGVAVAATSHPKSPKPLDAVLVGKTTQGIAIKLSKTESFGGRTFIYKATLMCTNGETFTDDYFSDDVKIVNNQFDLHFAADQGATLTAVRDIISADGRSATGALRIVEFYSSTPNAQNQLPLMANGPIRCDSGTVSWTAAA